MIKIDIEENELQDLKEQYESELIKWLKKKKEKEEKKGKEEEKGKIELDYFYKHKKELILCKPEEMACKWSEFINDNTIKDDYSIWEGNALKDKEGTEFGQFIKKMATLYNRFMQAKNSDKTMRAYWLIDSLGIDVCPYCNRNYIYTIKGNKKNDPKYRAEIDHFLPKSKYPIFALSFYNFVPSCPVCNHIKRDKRIKVNPWIGYKEGKEPKFRIQNINTPNFKGSENAPQIEIQPQNEDFKKLGIDQLYAHHSDIAQDILNRIQCYNSDAYKAILTSFQGIAHTESELSSLIWGNYTEPKDFSKRPLSKLTADILEQFDIKPVLPKS